MMSQRESHGRVDASSAVHEFFSQVVELSRQFILPQNTVQSSEQRPHGSGAVAFSIAVRRDASLLSTVFLNDASE
jgi:hypothetical protein